ncbi:hypothetical protein NG744_01365 [Aliarcobacter cryaerophilus]
MAKKINYSKDKKSKFINYGSGKDRITIIEPTYKKSKTSAYKGNKKIS